MRITTIRIDELPESSRASLASRGKIVGGGKWLEIESIHLKFLEPPGTNVGPAIWIRSEREISVIISTCSYCDKFTSDGKCKICSTCGGLRRVSDYARLSTHSCPEKRW